MLNVLGSKIEVGDIDHRPVPRVFLVPIFISEGYFSEQVIPRALGLCGEESGGFDRLQRHGTQTLFYCKPVGTHDGVDVEGAL